MPKRTTPVLPPNSPASELEKILADADALLRRRMKAKGLVAVHVMMIVTEDGITILRSSADADNLKVIAQELGDIAEQARAREPGVTEH